MLTLGFWRVWMIGGWIEGAYMYVAREAGLELFDWKK